MTAKTGFEQRADQAFLQMLQLTPEIPALMGVANTPELRETRYRLNDYSVEGTLARSALLKEIRDGLPQFDRGSISDADALSAEVFDFILDFMPFEPWAGIKGEEFLWHAYPVCHHDGAPSDTLTVLTRFHAIDGEESAEAYLCRLKAFDRACDDLASSLDYRASLGLVAPLSSLQIVIGEMEALGATAAQDTELVSAFRYRLENVPSLNSTQRAHYLQSAEALVERCWQGSLQRLLSTLKAQRKHSRDEIGAWALPNGEAYYRYCLQRQTSTTLSPDEIFEIGQLEVSRLQGELRDDAAALGFSGASLVEVISAALEEAAPAAEDEGQLRERILAHYRELVHGTAAAIRPYFGRLPRAKCDVVAAPRHLEGSTTTTYFPPSADGAYPGIFQLNLGQELAKSPSSRHQLAYHEAYPGHHLQLTLAQEAEHLPLFRRLFVVAGYLEGWAKYAESLPFELDLDRNPRYELRRKAGELISASNLMLDVGIHAKRWTRDEAIAFSRREALLDDAMATYIVDRLTVTPGQATAYSLGLDCMRDLRSHERQRLGDAFSLADFHDTVLEQGALPLRTLQRRFSTRVTQR